MAKFFHFKLTTIALTAILLSSCNGRKENLEIDFSDFKVPNKSSVQISNPEGSKLSKIKNELINYQNKEAVLSSVFFGKKDPFSEEKIIVKNLKSDLKLTGFLNTKSNKSVF